MRARLLRLSVAAALIGTAAALAWAPRAFAIYTLFTVAGTGGAEVAGQNYGPYAGGPATGAQLPGLLGGVAARADGGFLIAAGDGLHRVDAQGRIFDVPFSFSPGYPGARAVAALTDGAALVATGDRRVLRIGADGSATTLAGGGFPCCFGGDGGPATEASILPYDLAPTADGGFLIAEGTNQRVRKVRPDGTIVTVAGSGPTGPNDGSYAGDGGPATEARLKGPYSVAAEADGGFLIADQQNRRVRRVDPEGVITTIAKGVYAVEVFPDGSFVHQRNRPRSLGTGRHQFRSDRWSTWGIGSSGSRPVLRGRTPGYGGIARRCQPCVGDE